MHRIVILLLIAVGLAGCAPNLSSAPARPGVVQQRGASGNLQTVQLVVIPSSATCQLSGTAYRHGMKGSGLLSVPIKASPVTVYCTQDGYLPAKRAITSTLEEPGGLATQALTGGVFGFFKSVMIGQGQRYPPMVHMILPPLRNGAKEQQNLSYNRQLIVSNWQLLQKGRDIECSRGKSRVEASNWSVHCDTARFSDYQAEDLKAFDAVTRR